LALRTSGDTATTQSDAKPTPSPNLTISAYDLTKDKSPYERMLLEYAERLVMIDHQSRIVSIYLLCTTANIKFLWSISKSCILMAHDIDTVYD